MKYITSGAWLRGQYKDLAGQAEIPCEYFSVAVADKQAAGDTLKTLIEVSRCLHPLESIVRESIFCTGEPTDDKYRCTACGAEVEHIAEAVNEIELPY